MQKIGFIGLGIMGKPMATNLLNAGFELTVYNRTVEKTKELVQSGARLAKSPKEVAENSEVIITIVSDTADVEEVIFGQNGISDGISAGKLVVDMSTISVEATRGFAVRLLADGIHMLDAPVSGGDIGAINGTLTIMVGGDKDIFNRLLPVFNAMGKTITYMGSSGAGQCCKMANQIMVGANLMGVCEGLMLASKEGLDLQSVVEVIMGGVAASAQLGIQGPKIIKGDNEPGFLLDLFLKDLGIVKDAQNQNKLYAPITALIYEMFKAASTKEDNKNKGTQTIIKSYEDMSSHKI